MHHSTPPPDPPRVGSFEFRRLVLAVIVARRHYLDGLSNVRIGAELGISRFEVARLLQVARAAGIVRITVRGADETDAAGTARPTRDRERNDTS